MAECVGAVHGLAIDIGLQLSISPCSNLKLFGNVHFFEAKLNCAKLKGANFNRESTTMATKALFPREAHQIAKSVVTAKSSEKIALEMKLAGYSEADLDGAISVVYSRRNRIEVEIEERGNVHRLKLMWIMTFWLFILMIRKSLPMEFVFVFVFVIPPIFFAIQLIWHHLEIKTLQKEDRIEERAQYLIKGLLCSIDKKPRFWR
jgi:hypothetical protein